MPPDPSNANASVEKLKACSATEISKPGVTEPEGLKRHFNLLQATALNVTMIVGAGVFITIPFMLKHLPGSYAIAGWLAGGALVILDGMVWSELGATFPASGGSYLYLLECFGRDRWGRLLAFLFIWQFLISGPLEIASGLIAISQFAHDVIPRFSDFNEAWTWKGQWQQAQLAVYFGPAQLACLVIGLGLLLLLYRRISVLGKLTVTFWFGVMAAIAWIVVEGAWHFDPILAFDFPPPAATWQSWANNLGPVMILAMYSYLGYYNVCYIGSEVRDPGRNIPRSVLLSGFLVCLLFTALHLAMLGTVPWQTLVGDQEASSYHSLPAEFMARIHGPLAAAVLSLLLIWSCVGSAFAGLLGYSRIPYGAARHGHFFAVLGRVHPVHHIPHVSLFLVGGLTLFWTFFDLESVIKALLTTRILEQFVAQIIGLVILRRRHPELARPFKMVLYPLPCALALTGWLYLYFSTEWPFIALSLGTLTLGIAAFLIWSRLTGNWPFVRGVRAERPILQN